MSKLNSSITPTSLEIDTGTPNYSSNLGSFGDFSPIVKTTKQKMMERRRQNAHSIASVYCSPINMLEPSLEINERSDKLLGEILRDYQWREDDQRNKKAFFPNVNEKSRERLNAKMRRQIDYWKNRVQKDFVPIQNERKHLEVQLRKERNGVHPRDQEFFKRVSIRNSYVPSTIFE